MPVLKASSSWGSSECLPGCPCCRNPTAVFVSMLCPPKECINVVQAEVFHNYMIRLENLTWAGDLFPLAGCPPEWVSMSTVVPVFRSEGKPHCQTNSKAEFLKVKKAFPAWYVQGCLAAYTEAGLPGPESNIQKIRTSQYILREVTIPPSLSPWFSRPVFQC